MINTMDYNIFYQDKTNLKNIKFGKTQIFNDKKYIPIYYNDNFSNNKKYNDFLIKTPRLFLPNKVRKETGFKPSIELIMIEGEDQGVVYFKNILKKIQSKIKNQIKKRKKLNLKNKEFIPILRDDNKYKTNKMYIPLSIFTSYCLDLNNKIIKEWNIQTPTYGYFIIQVKNVWINNDKWGINLFCNGAMILPSQFMDPPPIPIQKIQYLFEEEINSLNTVGDNELYSQYFRMKKMRVPIQAIKNKMMIEGLDPSIIDLQPTTPMSKIKKISSVAKTSSTINTSGIPIPPPPPPPPPAISLQLKESNKSNKQNTNLHSQLFSELLSKSRSVLKNKINEQPKILNIQDKQRDNRVPSLEQIKEAIKQMKSYSKC